jgi:hypothetical protein
VKILKTAAAASKKKPSKTVAIISHDEKPGIQAIATTAPDFPPDPGVHAPCTQRYAELVRGGSGTTRMKN